MAYDLEEQEQIETLKAFWKSYGNFILTVITVVLLAIAGYRGWGWYQHSQATSASLVYEELKSAVEARDVAKVKQHAGTIFGEYGSTVYGPMAALLAARAYYDAGDLKAAKAPLQWAVDKNSDAAFSTLARIRLAGILLDEKAFDDALQLLPENDAGPFAGEIADRRGDILVAKARTEDARSAYKLALEKLDERSSLRRVVQFKLDALGGGQS
jgi:predicted negative regulator of RcsB-dependent stress response